MPAGVSPFSKRTRTRLQRVRLVAALGPARLSPYRPKRFLSSLNFCASLSAFFSFQYSRLNVSISDFSCAMFAIRSRSLSRFAFWAYHRQRFFYPDFWELGKYGRRHRSWAATRRFLSRCTANGGRQKGAKVGNQRYIGMWLKARLECSVKYRLRSLRRLGSASLLALGLTAISFAQPSISATRVWSVSLWSKGTPARFRSGTTSGLP